MCAIIKIQPKVNWSCLETRGTAWGWMKDKKKVRGEIARRYQKAGKKERGKLLDEYTVTPGYNRDYPAHILSNRDKKLYVRIEGKPVIITATPVPKQGAKARKTVSTGRKRGAKSQSIRGKPSRPCWRTSGTCPTACAGNSWPRCSASCRTS
jgi:hypothetical protein